MFNLWAAGCVVDMPVLSSKVNRYSKEFSHHYNGSLWENGGHVKVWRHLFFQIMVNMSHTNGMLIDWSAWFAHKEKTEKNLFLNLLFGFRFHLYWVYPVQTKKKPFSFTIVCIEIEDFISSNGGHPSNKCTDLEWYRTSWDTIEISFFVGGMHSPHHYLVHQIRSPVKSIFIVLLARTAAVKQSLGWVFLSYKYCAFNVVMLACYLASRLAPLFEGTCTQIPTVQKQPHK